MSLVRYAVLERWNTSLSEGPVKLLASVVQVV